MRTAFGLTLDGTGDRPVTITQTAEPDAGWDPAAATRLVDLRTADGAPYLHVDEGPHGYRLAAPDFGVHLVARGGRSIRTGTEDPDGERLLVAQTLPTAAALQGLDPMHASAVLTEGGVVALSGPSTSGKTTLAQALVAAGTGTAFADDVLALEVTADGLQAHPGPGIDAPPAPVAAFVLLDRIADPGPLATTPAELGDLMGAAFVPHVTGGGRLQTHLEVCAALSAAGTAHRLAVGPGSGVEATVASLLELLG